MPLRIKSQKTEEESIRELGFKTIKDLSIPNFIQVLDSSSLDDEIKSILIAILIVLKNDRLN